MSVQDVAYSATVKDGAKNVTVVIPDTGETLVADGSHPSFAKITKLLAETFGEGVDTDALRDLFDVQAALNVRFEKISERVTIRDGKVYFDGDQLYDELAELIVKFYSEQEDFLPLVNFMEKISVNPQPDSRQRLFAWLRSLSFAITPDGDFLAYKSVYASGDDDGVYTSISSGTAIVNGEEITGQIPQRVGDVVEMPRNNVDDNTHAACSTGLHAGTFGYANGFSGDTMLAVRINPRDVVSVPVDCGSAKLRVCRYTVFGVLEPGEEFDNLLVLDKTSTSSVQDEYGMVVDDDYENDDEDDNEYEDVPDRQVNPGAPRLENLTEEQVTEIADVLGVSTSGSKQNIINNIRAGADYTARRIAIEDLLARDDEDDNAIAVTHPDFQDIESRLKALDRDSVRKVARRVSVSPYGSKTWMINEITTVPKTKDVIDALEAIGAYNA